MSVPIAHLAHWAAVFYAAPVILLLLWAGLARLVRLRNARKATAGRTDPSSRK